jgi:hypothetical protein
LTEDDGKQTANDPNMMTTFLQPEFIDVLRRMKRYLSNWKDTFSPKAAFWLVINFYAIFPEVRAADKRRRW